MGYFMKNLDSNKLPQFFNECRQITLEPKLPHYYIHTSLLKYTIIKIISALLILINLIRN